MIKLVLNGKEISSEQQIHRLLADALDFPTWYGENLDALFDCITDVTDDVEISVVESDDLVARLGERALLILTVLRDAAAGNSRLKISVEK